MAGLVAFFAPCCSLMTLPSYLASAAGAPPLRPVLYAADGTLLGYGRLSPGRLGKQLDSIARPAPARDGQSTTIAGPPTRGGPRCPA